MAKVLIVDDSETLRSQVRDILESAGFAVVEARNGIEGLSKFVANPQLRLILCDVNMPEMGGIAMCKAIYKDHAALKVPIVMLTTEASVTLKNAGRAAGVVAWMTKPVDKERLIMAVKKIVGSAA